LKSQARVCPASRASLLATGLRRLVQNPHKILHDVITSGQTVVDLGCGPGFFTLDMARLVGDEGRVFAVDLQQSMLDILARRARKAGLDSRIELHLCEPDRIGLAAAVDFALAFYMVHEVPDPEAFLREVHDMLRPDGELLVVEPKFHVSSADWRKTVELAESVGFCLAARPRFALSWSAALKRSIQTTDK